MLEVVAAAQHYREYERDFPGPLEDLRRPLKRLCREHVRRVDRPIQLAMIGSALCVGERELAPDTGIYLASGLGPVASTAAVQEQMFTQGVFPKPVQFINTLANTAGFYVARNLGLHHQCLFVSRGYASFEAALELARDDLALGTVSAALVGMIDECTLPLGQHARRLRRRSAQRLAEGSAWLLLLAGTGNGELAEIGENRAEAQLECLDELNGVAALTDWLRRQPSTAWYWQVPTLDLEARAAVAACARQRSWHAWEGPEAESQLCAAVAAVDFINRENAGVLLSINTERPGCYQVSRYRV